MSKVIWDDESGTYVEDKQLKFPNMDKLLDKQYDLINEVWDNGMLPVKSGITGELIRPGTGEVIGKEDGKVLDKNGWRKE